MGKPIASLQALLVVAQVSFLLSSSAAAQAAPAGKVVALEGTATVTSVALPDPRPLAFKDDIFLRDRVATGDRSITRLLLGGKASVTVREHSVLYITEVPGTSTVNLSYGRISVAVSKDQMKPGEVVEIRTPNSVAAIRGTVVVAEVEPGYDGRSTITVLRGLIDVVKIDSATGLATGPLVAVAALQSVAVTGASAVPPAAPIRPDTAQQLTNDFRVIPKAVPSVITAAIAQDQIEQAKQAAEVMAPVLSQSAASSTEKDKNKKEKDKKDKHQSEADRDTAKDGSQPNGKKRDQRHTRTWPDSENRNDSNGDAVNTVATGLSNGNSGSAGYSGGNAAAGSTGGGNAAGAGGGSSVSPGAVPADGGAPAASGSGVAGGSSGGGVSVGPAAAPIAASSGAGGGSAVSPGAVPAGGGAPAAGGSRVAGGGSGGGVSVAPARTVVPALAAGHSQQNSHRGRLRN